MPTTKPVSDTLATNRTGTAAMADEGPQTAEAQPAPAAMLPQGIWETQLAMVSEILAFMGRRMQAQAEFCARLGCCTEIAQAVEAQQDFATGVGGAYTEEAERLSTLARRNMDAWSGVGAQYASSWTTPRKAAA
jgi:hypothetical protein